MITILFVCVILLIACEVLKMITKTKPATCNICNEPIEDVFIDGKTVYGPWADMCEDDFKKYGTGLGTGQGQRYERVDESDTFQKVEG